MLAVLVVTCPCALSLAAPMALAAATSSLARDGVLVTRADALEKLAHVDTVVLDKTGTLTSGAAGSVRVECLGDIDEAFVAGIARALERHSRHPLALALCSSGAAPPGSPDLLVSEWRDFPGAGIEARLDGELWRIGRAEFVRELAPEAAASDRSPRRCWATAQDYTPRST
jgi:Cu2+-exporting ATPase